MMVRYSLAVCLIAVAATACSQKDPERVSAAITAPSAVIDGEPGGVSRPAIVNFPARPDTLDFRTQLETKYASGLRRPVTQTIVDQEGESTWMGEYERYRVNGCDHDTAARNTLSQIDGVPAAQVCAVRYFPENAVYPSRDQVVDFRRQLGSKYQSMGRTAQSAVDPDGAAIWISEYLRYRTSGCDHATAVQKTMTQIDGNPAPPTCVTACSYYVSAASVQSTGGSFTAELVRTSGSCEWIALSETPWITLTPPITGGDRSKLTYVVASNTSTARTGYVRITYPGGTAYLEVNQGSLQTPVSFQMFDPATSTAPTTECQLKSVSTICTLTATTAAPPTSPVTYDWRVEYPNGGTKVKTQVGTLPTFSFTDSCAVSAAGGTVIPLTVRLIASDASGNSVTLFSGQGSQPALQLRTFNCP